MGGMIALLGFIALGFGIYRIIKRKSSEIYKDRTTWILLGGGLLLSAVGGALIPSDSGDTANNNEPAGEVVTEENEDESVNNSENNNESDESSERVIEVNTEEHFTNNFTVEIKEVKKDGNTIEIPLGWTNKHESDKRKFMEVASVDVEQDGELLEELTDAWSDTGSQVYFPNASKGGFTTIPLEYELINEDDPVVVTIVPREGDSKQIEINLE